MTVDYLGHSGFLVETEGALLLFDYSRGNLGQIDRAAAEKPLYVFVSHAHGDHYTPEIFSLVNGPRRVKYVLSFDLRGDGNIAAGADVLFAEANASYEIDGLGTVRTLLSTDEGVAFLVQTSQETVFHAGDLNWWDWPGEEAEWLAQQETVFRREIGRLAGTRIDTAFTVLDGRLEENFAEGLTFFLSVCRPAYVLPMHFWEDRSVVERFRALPGTWESETVLLDTTKETHWEI